MRDGDLILERSGGGPGTPVGRVAIIDGFGPVYCNNFCQHLRVDASRCSPFYVARALWHRYLQGVTTRLQHQTTGIRNLDYAGYLAFPLLLPPLPEQRAIAAVLDAIDGAIERTEAVITATERLRDSLLHELLTRGVPGWHTAWRDVPRVGTIPASWEVVRLREVCDVTFSGVDKRRIDGEEPVQLCNYTDVFYNHRIRSGMDFMKATATPAECEKWSLKRGGRSFY